MKETDGRPTIGHHPGRWAPGRDYREDGTDRTPGNAYRRIIADTIREEIQGCTPNGRGDIRARALADLAVRLAEKLNINERRDHFLTLCNVEYAGPMRGRAFDRPDEIRPL